MGITQRASNAAGSKMARTFGAATIGIAATAAIVAMAGPASANAPSSGSSGQPTTSGHHHGHGPGDAGRHGHYLQGSVVSVGSDNFVVADGSKTVTVDVSSTTTYTDAGVASPTLSNVTAGEWVTVSGSPDSSDTVTATTVTIGQPPALIFEGTVATLGTNNFTVTKGDKTVTIDVSPTTTYADAGVTSADFANVTAGERVATYAAATSTTDVVDALSVWVLPAKSESESAHL
jgi:hypothetical protein